MKLINLGCGKSFHSAWTNLDISPVSREIASIDLQKHLSLGEDQYQGCYLSHVLEHLPRARVPVLLQEIQKLLSKGGILRIVVPDLEVICRSYLQELQGALTGEPTATAKHEWMTMELIDQMTRTFSGGFMGRLWWSRPLPSREFIISRLGEEAGKWLDHIDAEIQKGAKPLDRRDTYQVPKQNEKEIVRFRDQGEIHQWMYDRVSLKWLLEKAGFQSVKVCGPTESRIPDFVSYHLDTNEMGETRKPDSLFMEAIKSG